MKKRIRQSDMGGLLTLLLLGVFAVCILSVLLTGAKSYKSLVKRDADSYDKRTRAQYIAIKVREADTAGSIFAGDFDNVEPKGEGDTLFILEEHDGITYVTRIYEEGGMIRELFTEVSANLKRNDGEKILSVKDLSFSQEGNRLNVNMRADDDSEEAFTLTLRSVGHTRIGQNSLGTESTLRLSDQAADVKGGTSK